MTEVGAVDSDRWEVGGRGVHKGEYDAPRCLWFLELSEGASCPNSRRCGLPMHRRAACRGQPSLWPQLVFK